MPLYLRALMGALLSALCCRGEQSADWHVKLHYTKFEFRIPMRDGKRLFTSVFVPKDRTKAYPFLITRTPYGVAPYGEDKYPKVLGPSVRFDEDGYIFVFQDVRGRYLSEGTWIEMTPAKDAKSGPGDVDESSDTYDTIDWLLKNVAGHNGKAGLVGISYPGFYTSAGMIDAHPALVAASPQAPISDLYMGDDAYHNGALFLAANFSFYNEFEKQENPEIPKRKKQFNYGTKDGYEFYLKMGPLVNSDENYFKYLNPYWTDVWKHPNYDDFWKARNILPHLKRIPPAVLVVGGWFDAEDLGGTLKTFRGLEEHSPDTSTSLVMGPWSHGEWERDGRKLGKVDFGSDTAEFFRDNIELPFFRHYLKGTPEVDLPRAYVFETGKNSWTKGSHWPPVNATRQRLYLRAQHKLTYDPPQESDGSDQYVSDPNDPVPYSETKTVSMSKEYMDADQRFVQGRPDVLTYQTEPLTEDLVLAGPISPSLFVATTGTDSDFVVKVIDVYPSSDPGELSGYEQLVRGEPFRGKFRNSFEHPEPFKPGAMEHIQFTMPDVYHDFRKGHRLMVQIQSSWFPLVDRNPQIFTEIPFAKKQDFQKATERIYRSTGAMSSLDVLAVHEQ